MVKRCLSGKVLRRDSEYCVCSCRHCSGSLAKVAVSNSKESNRKRETRNANASDGKPPRGPLLSDRVGKVLGKPSVESVDCDPVSVPNDEDDDAAEAGLLGEQDEAGCHTNNKVALLESLISHLKRAPIQTLVLSCLVTQLETVLSAALVERRESWHLWRQARRHQRQIGSQYHSRIQTKAS